MYYKYNGKCLTRVTFYFYGKKCKLILVLKFGYIYMTTINTNINQTKLDTKTNDSEKSKDINKKESANSFSDEISKAISGNESAAAGAPVSGTGDKPKRPGGGG